MSHTMGHRNVTKHVKMRMLRMAAVRKQDFKKPSLTARNTSITGFFFLASLLLFQSPAFASQDGYIGAKACRPCHEQIYNDWAASGHASILRKAGDPRAARLPLPAGFARSDLSYVVGGYRWKALYLDRKGYLVTSTTAADGRNQYNVQSRKWINSLSGDRVPYDCGSCHTTGYSPVGHQAGLPGIVGTWQFDGVQCEACHGPGSRHIRTSLKSDIITDRNICATCHETRPLDMVPVNGVFLAPYTEKNQLLKSTMKDMACIECHDPHRSAGTSIRRTCESCHKRIAEIYADSYLSKVGVTCIDCHMPPAGLLAEGDAKKFRGDLKSHLFRIDHHKEFPNVTVRDEKVNPGYLTVDYSCMRCHDVFETRLWAVSRAAIAHRLKATTNVKIMHLQMGIAYAGFFFAVTALLSAASLKKWFWPAVNMKKMASIHRHTAWITFALYVFESTLCIYFHFPLGDPAKALNLGWFFVHPIIGSLGVALYAGKIAAVRLFRKGWAWPGMAWGLGIFFMWLLLFITVILSFYEIVRV